jgi:hypothetical protein
MMAMADTMENTVAYFFERDILLPPEKQVFYFTTKLIPSAYTSLKSYSDKIF